MYSTSSRINKFDPVGQLHNDGLDFMLSLIVNVESTTPEYLSNKNREFLNNCCTRPLPEQFFVIADEIADKYIGDYTQDTQPTADVLTDLLNSPALSEQQKKYIQQMHAILDQSMTLEGYLSELNQLEYSIDMSMVDGDDKNLLMCGLAIGKYSLQYWHDNLDAWCIACGVESPKAFVWGGFGKSDLDGAITGGLAGAVIGGAATLGTLTVPSWVVGAVSTGLLSSASYCIGQLW